MVIGLAFSSAYKEFLKSHGVNEESLEQFEYQHVLSSQTKSDSELDSLKDQNKTKEVCTILSCLHVRVCLYRLLLPSIKVRYWD